MIYGNIDDALIAAFGEPIRWRQDKAPHLEGSFEGIVLQASPDSETAGHPQGRVNADQWTVEAPLSVALVAQFRHGDTLCRIAEPGAPVLSIAQIARTEGGWLIGCTANERAPM